MLRQITVNDLPVGRSVDETLRLVQAFQYTDSHGEGTMPGRWPTLFGWVHPDKDAVGFFPAVSLSRTVCPAGWKPGSATVRLVATNRTSRDRSL